MNENTLKALTHLLIKVTRDPRNALLGQVRFDSPEDEEIKKWINAIIKHYNEN